MSFASYLEDITDRAYDSWHMRGGCDSKPEPKPVLVVASPPLQPALADVVIPPLVRPDPAAIAERKRAQHEKHVLALYELMPGSRWRH